MLGNTPIRLISMAGGDEDHKQWEGVSPFLPIGGIVAPRTCQQRCM